MTCRVCNLVDAVLKFCNNYGTGNQPPERLLNFFFEYRYHIIKYLEMIYTKYEGFFQEHANSYIGFYNGMEDEILLARILFQERNELELYNNIVIAFTSEIVKELVNSGYVCCH